MVRILYRINRRISHCIPLTQRCHYFSHFNHDIIFFNPKWLRTLKQVIFLTLGIASRTNFKFPVRILRKHFYIFLSLCFLIPIQSFRRLDAGLSSLKVVLERFECALSLIFTLIFERMSAFHVDKRCWIFFKKIHENDLKYNYSSLYLFL